MSDYKNLSLKEIAELEELLEMNDQEMFDLIFKDNLRFQRKFPNIKRYAK
jgi:succinate dehydrogenase flavin-adding protein (antitoxin of CptAB toxin-antitoxin module)